MSDPDSILTYFMIKFEILIRIIIFTILLNQVHTSDLYCNVLN